MKRLTLNGLGILISLIAPTSTFAHDSANRRLGTLQCTVLSAENAAPKADESVLCVYNQVGEEVAMYHGTLLDPEIDAAEIKGGVMRWFVVGPNGAAENLAGLYNSVPAPEAMGLPPHSAILSTGDNGRVLLQPDVDPGDGLLNFAVGIHSLKLVDY